MGQLDGKELVRAVCRHADDKAAEDIVVLDLNGISTIADYFVICSGTSLPHIRAVKDAIVDGLQKDDGMRSQPADGKMESHWLVLDYGDVLVHVFYPEKREYYAIEDLWSDAPRYDWKEDRTIPATGAPASEVGKEA